MHSKVVAILESRTGEHLAELIARRGGVPMLAPALEEIPDIAPEQVTALLEEWRSHPFKTVVFQTGVGTRALFRMTDSLGLTQELLGLLARAIVVVRGPKPTGELNARNVRIDVRAASPFTTETVLEALAGIAIEPSRALVQRYGAANERLREGLEARGMSVREITTYRWALPSDVRPLLELLRALAEARVDAVVFTSAVQIHHLYAVAQTSGRDAGLAQHLNNVVVASIGPVCSRALMHYGIRPTFEADPPKLGPLLSRLDAALAASSQRVAGAGP